jgi:hypothetical protein
MWLALALILLGFLDLVKTTCPVDCQCGLQKWDCGYSGLRRVPYVDDEKVLIVSLRGCLLRDLTDEDMTRLGTSVVALDVSDQRGTSCVIDARKRAWPAVRVAGLCSVRFFLFVF